MRALLASLFGIALASNEAGIAFLAENGAKEGVVTLPSGLQYKVLTKSTKEGALTPTVSSPCVCHYAGTLIDGTEFDSSCVPDPAVRRAVSIGPTAACGVTLALLHRL